MRTHGQNVVELGFQGACAAADESDVAFYSGIDDAGLHNEHCTRLHQRRLVTTTRTCLLVTSSDMLACCRAHGSALRSCVGLCWARRHAGKWLMHDTIGCRQHNRGRNAGLPGNCVTGN